MLRPAICLLVLQASVVAIAEPTVVPDTAEFIADDQSFGASRITVFQAAAEPTAAWFSYGYTAATSVGEVEFSSVTLDEGSDWYLVREGDFFTPAGIESGDYVRLAEIEPTLLSTTFFGPAAVGPSYWSNNPIPDFPDLQIPNFATEFYLAFATDVGYGERDVFGWTQFRTVLPNTSLGILAGLELIGSATAYDSGGIVVGTLQAIPEPHAGALALLAALSAGGWRRRRA